MLISSKMLRRAFLCVALVGAIGMAQTAKAVVNHGDFVGTNIMYLDVTESPTKIPGPSPAQLFGAPTVSGNTLDFNPMDFNAEASGGSNELVDGLLSMTIMSNNAQEYINNLWISEFGAYSLIGGTSGGTQAGISIAPVQAKVTHVNGVALGAPIILPRTISYVNGGGANETIAFDTMTLESNGGALVGQPWSASVHFDLSQVPGATKIDLVLDNTLFATSEAGSIAFIDKKDFQIWTTVVPEPGTIILGLIGGLGMILVGRKTLKKQAA